MFFFKSFLFTTLLSIGLLCGPSMIKGLIPSSEESKDTLLMIALNIQFESFKPSTRIKVTAANVTVSDTNHLPSSSSSSSSSGSSDIEFKEILNECPSHNISADSMLRFPFFFYDPTLKVESTCCVDKEFLFSNHIQENFKEELIILFKRIKYSLQIQFDNSHSLIYTSIIMPKDYSPSDWEIIHEIALETGSSYVYRTSKTTAAIVACANEDKESDMYYSVLHFDENDSFTIHHVEKEDGIIDILSSSTLHNYTYLSSLVLNDLLNNVSNLLAFNYDTSIMTATPQEQQLNLTIIITTSFNYNAQQDMIINELIKNYHENSHIKLCRSIAFDKLIQMGQVLQSRDRLLAYQEEEDTILGAVDINPVHYGIELIGGVMYPILKMYSLEGPQSALFTSISTNKTNIIEMPIYRGFRTNVNHNKLLGTIYFNLQPNDIIRVIFDNEQKDVLNVTVINETTRKSHQMLISNKWQELVDEIILREQNWDAEIYEQNRYKDEEFKSVIEQRIESLKRLSWWKKKDILYKSFSFLLPKHERQEMEQLIELSKSNKLLSFSP